MGMLQERHDLTERDLATYRNDVGALRAERDHLANQVRLQPSIACSCQHQLSVMHKRLLLQHCAAMVASGSHNYIFRPNYTTAPTNLRATVDVRLWP